MGATLYVGADDSNHGGLNERGEFIVATFSLLHDDSIVRDFPNSRNLGVVNKWLDSGGDYRFVVCRGEKYNYGHNLPDVVPILVEKYLAQIDLDISGVRAYLDGGLDKWFKKKMEYDLLDLDGVEKVVVDNFIKRKNRRSKETKRYHCPSLVWMADILANRLYRNYGNFSDTLKHEKMIHSSRL